MMVVSPQGAMFLRSFDTTGHSKKAEYLADLMEHAVKEVGPDLVVQVVTDNATSCVAAGRILVSKYPGIIFSTCAAHTLDLLLEDIAKIQTVADLVKQAKNVCKTVCNHHASLAAFKSYSEKMILRPNDIRYV